MTKGLIILFLTSLISSNTFAQSSSYQRIVNKLIELNREYPEHSRIFSLGHNDQNIPIQGLQISSEAHSLQALNQSQHLIVGTHHGNERAAPELALKSARLLLEQISLDPLLSSKNFWVLPVLNISGYNHSEREENTNAREFIDPNRDYPDPCLPEKESFQLQSTSLLAQFLEEKNIVSAITIHGYIGTFTYPWGTHTLVSQTQDHLEYSEIARAVVQHNQYRSGTHAEVIYPAVGAFEDWAYWQHGIWIGLMEMSFFANQNQDAHALVEFFRVSPTIRSNQSSHGTNCDLIRQFPFLSRP